MSDSVYEDENALYDEPTEVKTTVANGVINLLKKRKPVILVLLGKHEWSPPITTYEYTTDNELLTWVRETITTGCIILHCSDEKFSKVNDVAEILHFNLFLIEGVPSHEMSGLAINMTHHLDVVNHADVEHISGFVGIVDHAADVIEDEEAQKRVFEDLDV